MELLTYVCVHVASHKATKFQSNSVCKKATSDFHVLALLTSKLIHVYLGKEYQVNAIYFHKLKTKKSFAASEIKVKASDAFS